MSEIIGRLRCPSGAKVGPVPEFRVDGGPDIDDSKQCGYVLDVTKHPTLKLTLVVKCRKHGEQLVNQDIWGPRVTEP